MSKSIKKVSTWMLLIMMIASLLAACSKTQPAQMSPAATGDAKQTAAQAPTVKPLDQVTLNIVYPGDPQPDQVAVNAEIEKRAASELNIKLNYQYYGWGDYFDKIKLLLLSGEKVDIFWTDPGQLATYAQNGSIAALDDVIAKAGQALKAKIDAKYWEPVKYKGKIYGIPAGGLGTAAGYLTLTVRKDLRLKYGVPEIKSYQDLLTFFAAVKKNNPEIVPVAVPAGLAGWGAVNTIDSWEIAAHLASVDLKTMKAINSLDLPTTKENFQNGVKMYKAGYVTKDILNPGDYRATFNSGKAAAILGDVYEYNNFSKQGSAIPGAQFEFVRILGAPEPYMVTPTWNFQSVNSNSKNIDRAVAFLNWIQKSQDNYDLMTLGIKDKHYILNADGSVGLPSGVDAAKPPYAPSEWMWQNPNFMRAKGSDAKDFLTLLKNNDADVKTMNPAIGFAFNQDPVKSEIAAVSALWTTYNNTLDGGVVDVDKILPEYQAKVKAAGIDRILAEIQKQLDVFMAAKK